MDRRAQVGDIHQPMHVSFLDDKGGNSIRVFGQCLGNLHATWDTCLVQYAVGPDPLEAATDLLETVTPDQRAQWNNLEPRNWANESFAIAEAAQTEYCAMQGTGCISTGKAVKVDEAYLEKNESVVKEQLLKAGMRLAWLLDATLGQLGGR
jgi:hypothetical protein